MSKWQMPALRCGDTIGLWTPASAVKPEAVKAGLDLLKARGFKYRLAPHAFSNNTITAATPNARVNDFHSLLRDNDVRAIWALRGGYGTAQMLPILDYDLLKTAPKVLIGFSDVTAFQWGIYARTGMPAVSGFTMTSQFSGQNPYLEAGLRLLSGELTQLTEGELVGQVPVVHRSGTAEGLLIGGTLSMICSIFGTSYFPKARRLILFIEDVDEPLYRIDRLFWQLHLGGFWKRVAAVVLGKFVQEDQFLDVYNQLQPLLPKKIPVVSGFPYGHFAASMPLPCGVAAEIRTSPFRLTWEPFIQPSVA